MPIINTVIAGGGTTPTGSISITSNGTYDVTDKATAVVNVPTTAPAQYIVLGAQDGKLIKDGGPLPDLTNITELDDYVLAHAYEYGRGTPQQINLDFSGITTFYTGCLLYAFAANTNYVGKVTINATNVVNGSAFQYAFYLSGVTEVEMKKIKNNYNLGLSAFDHAFYSCANLTKVTISDTTIPAAQYAFDYCFSQTGLSTLDVDAVTTIEGTSSTFTTGHQHMFGECLSLTNVTWSSLTTIARNAFNTMFSGSGLTTMSFPAVTSSSFLHAQALHGMLSGVDNCTLHFPSNVQTKVEGLTGYSTTAPFGATAGTVLFDLPATE